MKIIYVAGALNDTAVHYIQNMHKMIIYAESIRRKGYSIFVPCLDIIMGMVFGNYEYSDYFDNNISFLYKADAMFVVPDWENSSGTKREIEIAKQIGIPIFYELRDINV